MGNNCKSDDRSQQAGEANLPDKKALNKQCPRCGAWFHCSHSGKCWCMEYQLSPVAMEQLEATYTDCLCESCLSHFEKT